MKPIQYFHKEYLERSRDMTPDQIIQFLEDFRHLHGKFASKSRLISIKVPEALLNVFRSKAMNEGVAYQTKIKSLMKAWVLNGGSGEE